MRQVIKLGDSDAELYAFTNNVPRPVLLYMDLPRRWKQEFSEFSDHQFVVYKNWCYLLGDFQHAGKTFKGWDGYHPTSFSSGVLLRFVDYETVIMGHYYVS